MKRARGFLLLLLVAGLDVCSQAQLWSGVLSPSRAIDWSQVGVAGGIPSVTTPCPTASLGTAGQTPTFAQSVTAAQIRSAITACTSSSPRALTLNPGTYTLSGGIDFTGAPNVVVRGSGADQTFVKFTGSLGCSFSAGTNVCMESSGTNGFGGDGTFDAVATWSAGYAVGTSTITLSGTTKGSITGLQIGNMIFLDQTDDPAAPASDVFYSGAQGTASTEGSSGNGRNNRGQQQPVIVTSLCGSTSSNACTATNAPWSIGISPATRLPNIGSRTPQAWWNNGKPLQHVGIENMSLDYTGSSANGGAGVFMFQCTNCWVKGVRSVNSNVISRHVWMYQSTHNSTVDSYFYGAGGAADGYGPDTFNGADNLVQNNISQHVSEPFEHEGCLGCVTSYNYSADDFYNAFNPWQQASQYQHAVGNAFNLFEGNSYIATNSDDIHGSSNFVTIFRNYYSGRDVALTGGTAKTEMTIPVSLQSYQRLANVVGNVLGKSGYHTAYQCIASGTNDNCAANGNLAIFVVGYGGNEGQNCSSSGCNVNLPNDPFAGTSMMRWGNYDTVNAAVRWVSAEVPSGLANYANPVPATQTLPASFYLTSKPSWWGSSVPWAAIGPEVTGGNIANIGGHANLIPAANCYLNIMHGLIDGTLGALSFNAGNCYAVSQGPQPLPPTAVKTVVH